MPDQIPSNADHLRFVVALLTARDDETLVQTVIDQELADWPDFLHTAYLKNVLRVVVAQMFGPLAARVDREIGDGFVETGCSFRPPTTRAQPRGQAVMVMPSPEEVEEAAQLLPYLCAGMRGLERSHWRPSAYMPVEYLVAPHRLGGPRRGGQTPNTRSFRRGERGSQ